MNRLKISKSNIDIQIRDNDCIEFRDSDFGIINTFRNVDAKNSDEIEKLLEKKGYNYKNLTYNNQIHSGIIRKIDRDNINSVEDADALICDLVGVPLVVFTADCVPLVFFDRNKKAVGLAHAGWKGTYANIGSETVISMQEHYQSSIEDICVYIGPSIGLCCYEVKEDLLNKFKSMMKEKSISNDKIEKIYEVRSGKIFLNLNLINIYLLEAIGIKKENIFNSELCTSCQNHIFYSYRVDSKTNKRIGTIVQVF